MKYLNNIFGVWLIVAASAMTADAQQPGITRQGTIIYDRKVDMWRHLPDPQLKTMIPQFRTEGYEVLFRDSIAVYKSVPKDEAPDPFETPGGGGRMVLRIGGPGDIGILYTNFSGGRTLEETSLDDKKYIIADSIRPLSWRLTGDTSTILGHVCKKATATAGHGRAVVGWYTEDIALAVGPDRYSGLPGAVLKIDIDSGWMVFTATSIMPSVEKGGLRPPSGSKTITRAEFEQKLDQLMGPADSTGRRMMRRVE
jgi:GLPGLI family protein